MHLYEYFLYFQKSMQDSRKSSEFLSARESKENNMLSQFLLKKNE